MKVTAIVPSYKPDEKLAGVLRGLTAAGFERIIVVDDGSGHVDENETARQAVARECLEELGITVNPADMEFVHLCHRVAGGDGRTYYDMCFVIRKYQGEPAVMEPEKNAGLRWFPTEALPENTSTAVEVMLRPCLRGQPYSEVIHDLPVTSI